jgi:hypothetical protein
MKVIGLKDFVLILWNFIRNYPRVLFYWKGELGRVEFFFYSVLTFYLAVVFEGYYINAPMWILKYDLSGKAEYGYIYDILKNGMQRIPRGNPYYIYPEIFVCFVMFYCFSCVFCKRYRNMGCRPFYGFVLSFYFLVSSLSEVIDNYFDSINILGEKPEDGDLGDWFLRDYQIIFFYIKHSALVALFYWFFCLCLMRGNRR